jgi:hypothetical protein
MKPIENLWHWLIVNWNPLGIGAILGGCIGFGFNVFKWFVPSRADLLRGKREDERKELDASVFGSLLDLDLPRSTGGMTGGGMPLTLASEIANYLKVELEDVEDSLVRLEDRRRVKRERQWWFVVPH